MKIRGYKMSLPPTLRQKYLDRYNELINEGISLHESVTEYNTTVVMDSWVTRRPEQITYPTHDCDFPRYTQWKTSCLTLISYTIFALLKEHQAKIFASAIPRNANKPSSALVEEYLRKDHVFMFERFYYFLNDEQQTGLLVMDETENDNDRHFVRQMDRYFTLTATGQLRSQWIVPAPFFVSSDMAYPVQVADVCIYCINWGFRCDNAMDGVVRQEIADEFKEALRELEWRGEVQKAEGKFTNYGICYVPDPYESRQQKRR